MNPVTIIALAKHFEKLAKCIKLPPESFHTIDERVVLDVWGTVSRARDVQYTPTSDIPLVPALALVLQKAGFQRENAKALLIEVLTECINADEKAREALIEKTGVAEAIQHVRDITSALPKKTKAGATTSACHVTEVESVSCP